MLALFACGTPDESENAGADASASAADASDAAPDADPYCHYDCFGYHECSDGVVTSWDHTPVPCEYWEGECPHSVTYECERGCRTDVDSIGPFEDPRDMCEEFRPKQAGDPCTEEAHCEPQVATIDYQTDTVVNVYLTCDLELGVCVERDPPVVEDYLAQCGLEPPIDGEGYSYGVMNVDTCSGGLCLYVEGDTCVRQGCTIACDSDDDCPMGSVCQSLAYCKPGPPNMVGIDLTCP